MINIGLIYIYLAKLCTQKYPTIPRSTEIHNFSRGNAAFHWVPCVSGSEEGSQRSRINVTCIKLPNISSYMNDCVSVTSD